MAHHHRRALMRGVSTCGRILRVSKWSSHCLNPLHPNVKGARPGFIVVTRDTLRSPWHRFVGEIEWAKVNVGTGAGDERFPSESIEFAPDGITDPRAFEMAFKSRGAAQQSRLEGQPSASPTSAGWRPTHPNAASSLPRRTWTSRQAMRATTGSPGLLPLGEIGPLCVMDNDAELLRGQQTQALAGAAARAVPADVFWQ